MAYDSRHVKQGSNNTNTQQVNLKCIFISLTRWMRLQAELNFQEQNTLV